MKKVSGSKYDNCSINAFLTGAIVENTSHIPLDELARVNVFEPLGIQDYRWRHVPINRITGQGNLSIRTRDMAAIDQRVDAERRFLNDRPLAENTDRLEMAQRALRPVLNKLDSWIVMFGTLWPGTQNPGWKFLFLRHAAAQSWSPNFVRSLNRNAALSLDRRGRRAVPGLRRQFLLPGPSTRVPPAGDRVVRVAVSPLRDNLVQAQSKRETA